jgi:uncharacterized membrane protein YraQ (UPF0718 family)
VTVDRDGSRAVLRAEPSSDDSSLLTGEPGEGGRRWRLSSSELLFVVVLGAFLLRPLLGGIVDDPLLQTWSTIFVSIAVQALPFLVLGVLVSGAITAYVPPSVFRKILPSNQAAAVPVAGAAGLLLPGCECGSVPVAGGLMSRGVPPAAALTFLLSAPAINPVVLIATAVAFPGRPEFVLARFVASLAVAIIVGLLWARFGKDRWIRIQRRPEIVSGARWPTFLDTARHDFLHAGGFLVLGAILAATLNVLVPRALYESVASDPILGVLALTALAVLMSICSEADAFIAASLPEFSPAALLAFMVVGPMVDLKLVALQAGTFGQQFAVRFAPVTLVVAVAVSVLTAQWLL